MQKINAKIKRYKVPLRGCSPKLALGQLLGEDSEVDYYFIAAIFILFNSSMSILSSFWYNDETCLI